MITLQQDLFQTALHAVTRASTKSSLQAVFALVQLNVTSDGILHLSCFNGETAARATVNVDCNEDFSVCVDAATLKAVVETLTGSIRITTEDHALILQSASNRTTLRIVEEPLPVISEEGCHALIRLTGSALRSLLRVLPFASTDESRANLQVLHLTLCADALSAQTADGYSAGHVREQIHGPDGERSISLPLSFARLLATLVEDRDMVRIGALGGDRYLFQITNQEAARDLTFATVTTVNTFPSAQIATLMSEARATAVAQIRSPQAPLLQSIRMVTAMGTQSTFIKVSHGAARIASAETGTGQARNVLEGMASGAEASLWISAAFLKRAVEVCRSEVILHITDGRKPVLLESDGLTCVIMPMLSDGFKDPFPEDEAIAISLPDMAMD